MPDAAAAGYVAAVAALVRGAHPDLDAANVVNRLLVTATPVGGSGGGYGRGIVDPVGAVTLDVPMTEKHPLGDPGPAETFTPVGWTAAYALFERNGASAGQARPALPAAGLPCAARATPRCPAVQNGAG
jgi:hypothetical protein